MKHADQTTTLPKPESSYGYTWEQIREIFSPTELKDFTHWMRGQTGIIDPETGKAITYTHDVERYIADRKVLRG